MSESKTNTSVNTQQVETQQHNKTNKSPFPVFKSLRFRCITPQNIVADLNTKGCKSVSIHLENRCPPIKNFSDIDAKLKYVDILPPMNSNTWDLNVQKSFDTNMLHINPSGKFIINKLPKVIRFI